MSIFQRFGRACLVLAALSAWTAAGCYRPDYLADSGTDSGTLAGDSLATAADDGFATTAGDGTGWELPDLPDYPETDVERDAAADTDTDMDADADATETTTDDALDPAASDATAMDVEMAPLDLHLPAPAFRGTPVPGKEPNVEKPKESPRDPFFAPKGTINMAAGKPVTCSDPMPAAGEVDYVTDGDKEASDFGYLELRPGTEWVQVDLGQRATIFAVLVWHNHAEARVYRDVVVQVSDDPDFLEAETVFNNDYNNSSSLGIGPQMGYVETSEGKLVDSQGVEGRYVRFYSRGNHIDEKNHYTEIEVHGIPLP